MVRKLLGEKSQTILFIAHPIDINVLRRACLTNSDQHTNTTITFFIEILPMFFSLQHSRQLNSRY